MPKKSNKKTQSKKQDTSPKNAKDKTSEEKESQSLFKSIEAIVALIAAIVGLFVLFRDDIWKAPAHVYYNECFVYSEAGHYEEYGYLPGKGSLEADVPEAFTILSFIENPNKEAVRIESVSTEILSLNPIEEDVILICAALKGYTVKVYAINNGWAKSAEQSYDFYYSIREKTDKYKLEDISSDFTNIQRISLNPGEVREIAKFELIPECFSEYRWRNLYCRTNGNWIDFATVGYDSSTQEFFLSTDEMGGVEGEAPLFAVLDIDNPPTIIHYTQISRLDAIQDTDCIETVIAPTKSCYLECKNIYSVGGKKQETELMKITVRVPVYPETSYKGDSYRSFSVPPYGYHNTMIRELSELDSPNVVQIEQITRQYRHHPENLAPIA